ncbi:MAG: hypothetical protein ABSD20_10490 [Terriglobales bacterium]|jgi:DUF4097 and DUF4098 domain-containing protein YvlB
MNRRSANAIFASALVLILALSFTAPLACAQPSDDLREEFHQSYPLSPTGRVEVENINGDVTISPGDGNEVRVDAVKRARDSRRLSECRIVVGAHSDWVRIETKYPEHYGLSYNNPASVEYTIRIPRTAHVSKANLVNGSLVITGIAGGVHGSAVNGSVKATDVNAPLDLSSVNSSVDAEVGAVENDIRLHSVNGLVRLMLPSDAQAEIFASTVNGSIHNDFGLAVDKGRYVGSKMKARLGGGIVRVELNTVNGAIELRHANDGKPLTKATEEPEPSGEPL